MGEPFLGEIRMFAQNFAPKGWAMCNGQLLPINQYQALFSLLGTTYGGNGQTTFALPNLKGRAPVHYGQGTSLSHIPLGDMRGEEAHTLTISEMPAHTHTVNVSSGAAQKVSPSGSFWAARENSYATVDSSIPDMGLSPIAVATAGGSQPHQNMQPYTVMNFCIAIEGIFPSRN
ncbi:tail fiber protein [Brevibacillus nitrificans]|uniref:phage tail protein n=1 Tax=Brevibacillus nitrificans TaxID=651560 RepID=UPI00285A2998|nr:tail fiber protein [Brevibacillus nitrificans]MDR7316995.1 microcystin-dependent protein [Brevibacillus nitrificans]